MKNYLNLSSSNSDTLLADMINSASAYIDNWTNRTFSTVSKTVSFNGNGSNIQMLRDYPIVSVSSVVVDGKSYIPSDGKSIGYVLDDYAIYLIGDKFNKGFVNVSITYTSGFASVPADIKQVAIELVAYKFKESERVGISTKTMAGEVISYDLKDIKEHVKNILNNYNRVVPL